MSKSVESSRKPLYLVIIFLSLVGLIASVMIYQLHAGSDVAGGFCDALGDRNQCDLVGASPYAKLIFGIDNSIFGLIGFSVLIFLAAYQYFRPTLLYRRLIFAGAVFSSVLAVVFLALQEFVIHAYCAYCVIVDIASIMMLIIMLVDYYKSGWKF
jgi:uncharacterized membrane protein